MKNKFTRTVLETDQFLERTIERSTKLLPYRNSDSEKEGITIPVRELIRLGVKEEQLTRGTRFKLAVNVEGLNKLPLIQGHINKKGGYITDKVARYHEEHGNLPKERLRMGDRRKGTDYVIDVCEVIWEFNCEPSEGLKPEQNVEEQDQGSIQEHVQESEEEHYVEVLQEQDSTKEQPEELELEDELSEDKLKFRIDDDLKEFGLVIHE